MSKDVSQDKFKEFVDEILFDSARAALPWFADKHARLSRRIAAEQKKSVIDKKKLAGLIETRENIIADRQAVEWALSALRDRMVRFEWLSNKLSTKDKIEFLFMIWGALGAAFEIGSKANASTSAIEYGRSENAAKGGKKSGSVRQKNRHWISEVEELAAKIRADQPDISQDDLATEIAFSFKSERRPPGHDTLKDHISKMEKGGKLPRRRVAD